MTEQGAAPEIPPVMRGVSVSSPWCVLCPSWQRQSLKPVAAGRHRTEQRSEFRLLAQPLHIYEPPVTSVVGHIVFIGQEARVNMCSLIELDIRDGACDHFVRERTGRYRAGKWQPRSGLRTLDGPIALSGNKGGHRVSKYLWTYEHLLALGRHGRVNWASVVISVVRCSITTTARRAFG